MQVSYNGKKWNVSRKYRSFCELHERLVKEYPHVKFPDSAIQFMSKNVAEIVNSKKVAMIDDRRNNLQKYLNDLSMVPLIRESTAFRQFLGMDINCPEEYENFVSLSGSYFLPKTEEVIDSPTQEP